MDDLVQDVFAGLLAKSSTASRWDPARSSWGGYVVLVANSIMRSRHRRANTARRRAEVVSLDVGHVPQRGGQEVRRNADRAAMVHWESPDHRGDPCVRSISIARVWSDVLADLEEKDGPLYRAYAEQWIGRGLLVGEVRRRLDVDTDNGRRIQDVIRYRIEDRCSG